jgi:drug/metabolite transporter (DMT)-like permease
MKPPIVPIEERSVRRRGQLFVALAALAWSSAGVLQRQISVGTTTQLAGRALFACVALAGFVVVSNRGRTIVVFRSMGTAGFAVAICTAIASGSFIVALNHATVANVLFLQAAAPIAAALLAWIALGEAITRRALVAMGIALLGVALMVGGPGSGGVLGVGVSLVMTLAFATTIVITRHRRDVSMAPAICLSQALVVVAVAPFAHPSTVAGHDLAFLVLLGAGQVGLGLAFLTVGARLIPAAEVALITLLEIVLGPLWVWIALGEANTRRAFVAMGIAVLGVALMVGGPGSGGVLGGGVSVLRTLAFAASIVITRHRRDVSMAPAICLSQALVVVAVAPFAHPSTVTGHDLAFLVLLGAGQVGLGLAFLTVGARLIPAAEVALITLLEIVLGPLWVWIVLGERPALIAVIGGVVVIFAVVLQMTQSVHTQAGRSPVRAVLPD